MLQKKHIPMTDAIVKIRTFCNYRERCHKEVREKLYSMGLFKKEVDQALLQMMDEDLLNEERFARSFARGYFRTKRWGKYKIQVELQQRQIHANLIKKALLEIDADEYRATIAHLAEKKHATLSGVNATQAKQKVTDYLLRKGYTYAELSHIVDNLFPRK